MAAAISGVRHSASAVIKELNADVESYSKSIELSMSLFIIRPDCFVNLCLAQLVKGLLNVPPQFVNNSIDASAANVQANLLAIIASKIASHKLIRN